MKGRLRDRAHSRRLLQPPQHAIRLCDGVLWATGGERSRDLRIQAMHFLTVVAVVSGNVGRPKVSRVGQSKSTEHVDRTLTPSLQIRIPMGGRRDV